MYLVGFGKKAPSGPILLFEDLFEDTNGTTLTSHTPDVDLSGLGWAMYQPSAYYQIQNNKADPNTRPTPTSAEVIAYNNTGHSDVKIVATGVRCSSQDNWGMNGIACRYTSNLNVWYGVINYDRRTSLYEVAGGTQTLRTNSWDATSVGVEYGIEMTLLDESITVKRTGGSSVTYSSATANKTATRHGIQGSEDDSTINSISISTL